MILRKLSAGYVTALAILAGAVALGAIQNIVFIRSLGTDWETQAVWIGLAVLSAGLKIRAPLTPGWHKSPALLAAFGVALAFDVLCAIGHGAQTRGAKLDAHAAVISKRAEAAATVQRLERELASLVPAAEARRPIAAVAVALDTLKTSSGCMRDESWRQCPVILAPLKTELAEAHAAERRAAEYKAARGRLSGQLDTAREALAAAPAPTHPDPQAKWLAETFGIAERAASSWQTVLGMLILELGVVAGAIMANQAKQPAPKPVAPPSQPKPVRKQGAGAEQALETMRRIVAGQLVAAGVSVSGRTLEGSQTALALACGCSQPSVAKWLAELQSAGQVAITKAGRTTRVTLL